MAVRVELAPTLRVGEPRRLFSGPFLASHDMGHTIAVSRDGRRLLMVRTPKGASTSGATGSARQLLVVQNWFADLRRSPGESAP